jgi:hypothetical protein
MNMGYDLGLHDTRWQQAAAMLALQGPAHQVTLGGAGSAAPRKLHAPASQNSTQSWLPPAGVFQRGVPAARRAHSIARRNVVALSPQTGATTLRLTVPPSADTGIALALVMPTES